MWGACSDVVADDFRVPSHVTGLFDCMDSMQLYIPPEFTTVERRPRGHGLKNLRKVLADVELPHPPPVNAVISALCALTHALLPPTIL